MFEILSTIGLTASASIVIGFLAYAMAETPRGRLTVAGVLAAWFALVLAIGASAALDPVRGFGVPALGLTVGLPVAALVGAFFAFRTDSGGHAGDAFAGAGRGAMRSESSQGDCSCFSMPRANCRRRSRRAQAGATFSPASRRCRSPGRSCASAARVAAARLCVERHRDRRPRQRDRAWRPVGAGSASGLRRSADERHHDHPALAHRSGISGAEPDFHSRRHFLLGCSPSPKLPAQPMCGAALEASRSRPETADAGAYAPASEVVLGDGKPALIVNGGAPPSQPARRRPSPQA